MLAEIRNRAAEAKFDHFGPVFFAKSPCPDGCGELLFFSPNFHFFGCQGGLFSEASPLCQNCGEVCQNCGATASWPHLIDDHH